MKLKRQTRVTILVVWTVGVLLAAHAMRDVIGGRFKEDWFFITAFCLSAISLFAFFLRWVVGLASTVEDSADAHLPVKGSATMPDKPDYIFQNPAVVNIHNTTTHNNVQGGIIGSGTVNVHQHFEEPQFEETKSVNQSFDEQTANPIEPVSEDDTTTLEALLERAETLMGRPLAENTIRNILARNDIEACGEEKRGRARAKVYPKVLAEKAVAEYVLTNKDK